MASYDTMHAVVNGQSLGNRFSTFFSTLGGTVSVWNDARQTRKALGKLSDHELDDLGLTRGDIANMTGRLKGL